MNTKYVTESDLRKRLDDRERRMLDWHRLNVEAHLTWHDRVEGTASDRPCSQPHLHTPTER